MAQLESIRTTVEQRQGLEEENKKEESGDSKEGSEDSPSVMNLGPQGWTKEQLLYMSNTRELDRVPSTEQSTLYTNPHSPC